MAKKTDKAFEGWLRDLRLAPEKVTGASRDIFRQIYERYVALRRTDLVRQLNATRVADRRMESRRGKVTTNPTVEKWVEGGCPVNADGTVSPLEVCAFLATERKDAGGGRKSAAEKAAASKSGKKGSRVDSLSERMRDLVESGDVVGLIGLLMDCTDDLPTAEAVSKIVCNVINAEKGRVKAQSDEYERRIRNGELLEMKVVEMGRIERARFIRETLEGLGSYAPRLQGKTVVGIRQELEEIGRDLMQRLAGDEECGDGE